MKTIILLGLLLAPVLASAQVVTVQGGVCNSSWTVNTVALVGGATNQIDLNNAMQDRKWLEVQNISTDVIHCAQTGAVSTTAGRLLTASGGTWTPPINAAYYSVVNSTFSPYATQSYVPMGIFCKSSSTGLTEYVVISQCK